MVFRKYRAVKQWGKMDTRIFKEIYNSRNKRKMLPFQVPEAVQAIGAKVYEANDSSLFPKQNRVVEPIRAADNVGVSLSRDEHHPMYRHEPAYVFDGSEPMSDGIAQAALLTRSVVRYGLPETILNHSANIEVDEEAVRDAILHGEKYDPTLEKLPERFDPVMFWIKHVRVHGTPVMKRNNIILNNLLRQVVFAGLKSKILKSNFQINRDEYLSVKCDGNRFFNEKPFVLRGQPHLTVQSTNPSVFAPWAGKLDVKAASEEPLPDIYPISPVIDLSKEHIYNDELFLTRQYQQTHIHSILWSREQNQKYPWTSEQNMANAILTTYAAAVAESTRTAPKTALVRGVQLVDGRLDLVAMQLNTLNLDDNDEKQKDKNIVWIEKGIRLYKPKPYYEQMDEVEKLDIGAFKKFMALMLGFDIPHAH